MSDQAPESAPPPDTNPQAVEPEDEYYCHHCQETVNDVTDQFTCPQCGQGFLEKVEREAGAESDDSEGAELGWLGGGRRGLGTPEDFLRNVLSNLAGAAGPPPVPNAQGAAGGEPGAQGGRTVQSPQGVRITFGGGAGNHPYPQIQVQGGAGMTLPDLLFGILGGLGGHAHGPQMVGNPGDYAWGENGLDAVITNLLNQFETQSPTLSKEEIAAIPRVTPTPEQIANRTQCSTCMEELGAEETVLKLRCSHCFHEPCILPWLESHNTCPICRKVVGGDTPQSNQPSSSNSGNPAARLQSIDELD